MSKGKILQDGYVVKEHKAANFEVKIEETDHIVHCTISGKIRTRNIKVCIGDKVSVELSPYDLERGRIVWRYNK